GNRTGARDWRLDAARFRGLPHAVTSCLRGAVLQCVRVGYVPGIAPIENLRPDGRLLVSIKRRRSDDLSVTGVCDAGVEAGAACCHKCRDHEKEQHETLVTEHEPPSPSTMRRPCQASMRSVNPCRRFGMT